MHALPGCVTCILLLWDFLYLGTESEVTNCFILYDAILRQLSATPRPEFSREDVPPSPRFMHPLGAIFFS